MTVVCVLTAALAVGLWVRPTPSVPAQAIPAQASRPRVASARLLPLVLGVLGIASGTLAASAYGLSASHVVLLGVALGLAWSVAVHVRRAARQKIADTARGQVVQMLESLVADLRSGRPTGWALRSASEHWPVLGPAARAAELSGDVPAALGRGARQPGCEALRHVACAWAVAASSGAPLAGVLDQIVVTLREDDETRAELVATLAAPRSTARLLAVLPLVGLGLGAGLGGDPLAVLVGTPLGAGCLAIGATLAVAGVAWVDRLTEGVDL